MSETEQLHQIAMREASAYVALADSAIEAGHSHGDELARLALDILNHQDWSVVLLSMAIFEQLLEKKS
jgi:hypothetical protein